MSFHTIQVNVTTYTLLISHRSLVDIVQASYTGTHVNTLYIVSPERNLIAIETVQ